MEFGAHLPVLSLTSEPHSIDRLTAYAETASQLGFTVLSANDHMVYSRPILDSLTALSLVIEASGQMKLMTSIALLVIRGAAPLAKALAAIDLLSGGRMIVGAGPGSSPETMRRLASRSRSAGSDSMSWSRSYGGRGCSGRRSQTQIFPNG